MSERWGRGPPAPGGSLATPRRPGSSRNGRCRSDPLAVLPSVLMVSSPDVALATGAVLGLLSPPGALVCGVGGDATSPRATRPSTSVALPGDPSADDDVFGAPCVGAPFPGRGPRYPSSSSLRVT